MTTETERTYRLTGASFNAKATFIDEGKRYGVYKQEDTFRAIPVMLGSSNDEVYYTLEYEGYSGIAYQPIHESVTVADVQHATIAIDGVVTDLTAEPKIQTRAEKAAKTEDAPSPSPSN